MQTRDKAPFMQALAATMMAYGKALPDAEVVKVWWQLLEPFPLPVVLACLTAYRRAEPAFAPVPAAIEQRCLASDGRPEVEEAWAIAMRFTDEVNTVVHTEEIHEAYWACAPMHQPRPDQVAGRLAFKQTYERLVREAREVQRPVKWTVSPGKHRENRDAEIRKAVLAGRLPAPEGSNLLLEGPGAAEVDPEGMARLRAEFAKLVPCSEKQRLAHEAKVQADRAATEKRKRELAEQAGQPYDPEAGKDLLVQVQKSAPRPKDGRP